MFTNQLKRIGAAWMLVVGMMLASACGDDAKTPNPDPVKKYSVGGTVSGLTGTLVIRNNGGDDLTITADGDFTFETEIEDGEDYNVTIHTLPDLQSCSVSGASGTVEFFDVATVEITCS